MSVPPLSQQPDPEPVPDAVFTEMLRAARALLAMRHPLDAELGVSEMLGSWWGRTMPGVDVDRLFGEGLVEHATESGNAAGLALLVGVATLGTTPRQRALAEKGVDALTDRGVNPPVWGDALGAVHPVSAHISGNRFGDTDDVICTFRYDGDPGAETDAGHALIAVVDHNSGGILRDAWVTTKVGRLLEHCREEAENDPMATFTPIRPAHARVLLERAIERTDRVLRTATTDHPGAGDPASDSLAAHQALARARVRALPREPRVAAGPVWRRDSRATLAARFLASDAAAELSDSYTASRCVDHIISYGCDFDAGRPLRVSPRKVAAFLLTWLPRRVFLLPEEQEAMPHVLAAWIRWAGPRHGLPEVAVGATLDALWDAVTAFSATYPDPAAAFGLRQDVIRRLLPDGDLTALARRMFAFPLLTSDLLAESESEFDPATRAGRRALLRLDHFGEYDAPEGRSTRGKHSSRGRSRDGTHARGGDRGRSPVSEEELARHERLAERLWNGEPPSLWAAAQRLLDRGHGRPAVLRSLLAVLDEAEDDGDLVKRLDDL